MYSIIKTAKSAARAATTRILNSRPRTPAISTVRLTASSAAARATSSRVATISAMPVPTLLAVFFFRAEDGIRAGRVTGVQTCALPISVTRPLEFSRFGLADWEHWDLWGEGLQSSSPAGDWPGAFPQAEISSRRRFVRGWQY